MILSNAIAESDTSKNIHEHNQSHETIAVAFDAPQVHGFRDAFFKPFTKVSKIPVSENYFNANLSALPQPIPSHWHLISVSKDILINECQITGRLKIIDWSQIPHKDYLHPSALESCGIGYGISATVLAYSLAHKYGTPPFSWEAIFDIARYSGIRALPKQARGNLEIALLADGVMAEEIYPLLSTAEGQKRAFDKLESLKTALIWWKDLDKAQDLLLNGDIALLVGTDTYILGNADSSNIGIMRNQSIYKMNYFAIPNSSPRPDLAYSFISFASQFEPQLALAEYMLYGLANQEAKQMLPKALQIKVSNYPLNLKNGILEDSDFYAKHGIELEQKFQTWLNQLQPDVIKLNPKPLKSSD